MSPRDAKALKLLLLLYYMVMYPSLKATKVSCVAYDGASYIVDISNSSMRDEATRTCRSPKRLSLVNDSILVITGDVDMRFLNWVMRTKHVEMCVALESSNASDVALEPFSFTGYCKGPKLRITCNPSLRILTWAYGFTQGMVPEPHAVRIRGNKLLKKKVLENWKIEMTVLKATWDLQEFGECSLPTPFTSMESLDRNCIKFYGTLSTNQELTEIEYDPLTVHKFEVEGCIQIENTNLKDVNFLNAFSDFRPIPFCLQFIRNNKNLCYKNINYLNTFFKTLTFSNNSENLCDKCLGGKVSESYLSASANCSTVYGDLIIADHRGLPANIGNLHGVETINGRLIITNNTGLGKFVHLPSLKKVGSKKENGAAVIVKDNADLKLLVSPILRNINIKEGNKRVELGNNPIFAGYMEQIQKKNEVVAMTNKLGVIDGSRIYAIISGAAVVVLLILLSTAGIFVKMRRKKYDVFLPDPPHALNQNSQEQLTYLCMEIVKRNPMVWCVEEIASIWKQAYFKTEDNKCAVSKLAQFVKSHVVPTARNARVSKCKAMDQKFNQKRIQELLAYEWIIVTGTINDVSNVIAPLPYSVGSSLIYTDGKMKLAYKLLEITQLSATTSCYKYEVEDMNQRRVKKHMLILYQWPQERLPSESSELLRLFTMFKDKKVICASDRRKEVFSLLYLLYAIVVEAKGPKSVVQALSLHSCFCNGAPLDRHEVLYAMKFLLDWSNRASCASIKVEKVYARWCQIYDHMAAFSRNHTNIVNIHPLHLTHLDGVEEAKKEVESAQTLVKSLSERPFEKMQDRFRRKKIEEIKRELMSASKSTYGATQSINTQLDFNIHSMYNSMLQKTGRSMKRTIGADSRNVGLKQ